MAATVQGRFTRVYDANRYGPLPGQLYKTTITVPTGKTSVSIQPANEVQGVVVAVEIDPVTLTASATIKGYGAYDGFSTPEYFLDYTVPNPAIETREALNKRLRVHGKVQIDVDSATAGDSFVLYVWVDPNADTETPSNIDTGTVGSPSADVISVQDMAAPWKLVPNSTQADQALTVDATAGGVKFASLHADTTAVEFDVQTADVRVTFDGSAPTSTNGHLLPVGYSDIWPKAKATAAKFIRTGGTSAVIHASQLKGA